MLASQILEIIDEQYVVLFMGGLKEEIRLEVQTLDAPTGYKAISMARNVERKLIRVGVPKVPTGGKRQNYLLGGSWQNNFVATGTRNSGRPIPQIPQNFPSLG